MNVGPSDSQLAEFEQFHLNLLNEHVALCVAASASRSTPHGHADIPSGECCKSLAYKLHMQVLQGRLIFLTPCGTF